MWIIKKILGLIIILTALSGLAISVGCVTYSGSTLDNLSAQAANGIDAVNLNLDNTVDTLLVAQDAVNEANESIETLSQTAANLATTVSDTEPLISQINEVTTSQIPQSLETVQKTIPNIAEVAGTVDDTLTALSNFGFAQDLPLIGELGFDLGIDYDPTQRFDASIVELGSGLDDLPEELRALQTEFETTQENLGEVSENINTLSLDLLDVSQEVGEIPELLNNYVASINETQNTLRRTKGDLENQITQAKQVIFYLAIWFSLLQLAPLVYGIQLLFERRPQRVDPYAGNLEPAHSQAVDLDKTAVFEQPPLSDQ